MFSAVTGKVVPFGLKYVIIINNKHPTGKGRGGRGNKKRRDENEKWKRKTKNEKQKTKKEKRKTKNEKKEERRKKGKGKYNLRDTDLSGFLPTIIPSWSPGAL
jgi:hypothetical protein